MSANGKYLVINYEQYTGGWEAIQSVARYNTENDSLELFTPNAEDEMFVNSGSQVFGSAVSDEGTIIGFYGGLFGPRLGFIWKKGDESIKALASEFPKATLLADYDNGAFNVPAAISADGRFRVEVFEPTGDGRAQRIAEQVIDGREGFFAIGTPGRFDNHLHRITCLSPTGHSLHVYSDDALQGIAFTEAE